MLVIWCCVQVLMCLHQNQWLFKGFFCRLHAIFLFLLIFFSKVRIMILQKMIVISSEPWMTAFCPKMFFSSLGYGHWIEAKHLWEVANRNFQMIKSNVKSGQRNFQMTQKQYKDYVDKRRDTRILWTSHHVEEVSYERWPRETFKWHKSNTKVWWWWVPRIDKRSPVSMVCL